MVTHEGWIPPDRSTTRLVLLMGGPLLLLVALAACLGCPGRTSLPSLKGCTHIEIEYRPCALQHLITDASTRNLLSPEEAECLQSFRSHVVTAPERLDAFARSLSTGRYVGPAAALSAPMYVTCYRGERRMASFVMSGRLLVTEDRRQFRYPMDSEITSPIDAPQVHPFRLRVACATNLITIRNASHFFNQDFVNRAEPNLWADFVVARLRDQYASENGVTHRRFHDPWIFNRFRCPGTERPGAVESLSGEANRMVTPEPSAMSSRSDYAINDSCRPASPADTVLLFETRPGWNQHGGPELFTFDNHDPRGGVVLLNDGTVRFIRTEEELKQLRWK